MASQQQQQQKKQNTEYIPTSTFQSYETTI